MTNRIINSIYLINCLFKKVNKFWIIACHRAYDDFLATSAEFPNIKSTLVTNQSLHTLHNIQGNRKHWNTS